ncbi:hypothetical protein L6452_06053 [Arctium lappa]|uniref:Uncharacterized protein n=1 Tax=Arctium lappa TaxID=4217 RepID=A0ACB9EHU4_ARCLA|nr:hypothetical protein L6452_06053 [Arctium lappa]
MVITDKLKSVEGCAKTIVNSTSRGDEHLMFIRRTYVSLIANIAIVNYWSAIIACKGQIPRIIYIYVQGSLFTP